MRIGLPKDATKPNKEALLDEFDDPTPLPEDYNIDNWRLVSVKCYADIQKENILVEPHFKWCGKGIVRL